MKTNITKKSLITIFITLAAIQIYSMNLEFRIKIFEHKSKMSSALLSDFFPLRIQEQYSEVGMYDDYLKAMKAQYELEEIGFSSSEIVAYFKNTPISIDDAFTLLDNRNEQDQFVHSRPLTEMDMELALKRVRNTDFYYTIFIRINDEQDVSRFFDLPKTHNEFITENAAQRYAYGKYSSFQNANDVVKMIKEQGLSNVEIVAFDSLERISLTIAIEKEKLTLEQTLAEIGR